MITLQLRFLRAAIWFTMVALLPVFAQITESPRTVAPGRVLVEMDGLRFSVDRSDNEKFSGLAVASTLVTAGLTDSLDVQVGVDVFLRESVTVGGARDSHSGLGDTAFRMKWTFWRNEQLGAAMAVIPFVKIPSSTGSVGADSMEGGVILPWAMKLRGGTTAGAMFRWDVLRNDADDGYDARWHATGFVQQNLTKALAIYGESTLVATSTGFSKSAGTIGVGGLLQLTKSVELDYELQRGVNSRASDWTHVFRVNWGW